MLGALQFLTILPVRSAAKSPGESAAWFPVVGVLLGILAAAVLPLPQGALLALALVAAITGGLHEDGLADVCDAIRAYRTRERMHEILHDSRIGAHGALAIVFSVLLRWQALTQLQGDPWIRIPAALGIARGMVVLLAAVTPPAGSGLGKSFCQTIPRWAPWLVTLQVAALALLAGPRAAAIVVPLQIALLLLVRAWSSKRIGGVTGDCLGFLCQLSEAASLTAFTCV